MLFPGPVAIYPKAKINSDSQGTDLKKGHEILIQPQGIKAGHNMNDDLQIEIAKYLESLRQLGGKGAEFVADQAPETVRQFLAWELWSHSIEAVACLIGAIVCSVLLRKVVRAMVKSEAESVFGATPELCMGVFFCAVFVVVLGVGSVVNALSAIKTYVSPNVVLIEKVAEIAKGKP